MTSVRYLLLLLVLPGMVAGAASAQATSATEGTSRSVAMTAPASNSSRGATSGSTKLINPRTRTTAAQGTTTSAAAAAPSSKLSPESRWYSLTSAFNQPIPPGTPYRPNDARLISALVDVAGRPLGPGLSSTAVYFADPDTPSVTVRDNFPACDSGRFEVPIPRGAKTPSELNPNNREPTMVVMQRRTGIEWSMFKITAPGETPLSSGNGPRCPRNGDWNAIIVTKLDPAAGAGGWQGLANEACCSGAASQIYYPAGLVRPRDVRSKAPTWGHALSMSYGGVLGHAFVYPAKAHGGFCRDLNSCVPMGARFQLDPRFDCSRTRLLVYRWERQACRTMQVYGMIIKDSMCVWPCRGVGYGTVNSYSVRLPMSQHVDGGGSYRFPFDTASGYREMPVEILRHLHVIDWTKWTGALVLATTVERSGAVSLRDAHGRRVVRIAGGNYVIIVQDRSRRHGFRLVGPQLRLLRLSGKKYVGMARRRIPLVVGKYRYSGGAGVPWATFSVR